MICDFAQYYNVLNWRTLPLRLAATLAAGLPQDSRSVVQLSGQRIPCQTQLLALLADRVSHLEWLMFGCEGSRPPASVLAALTGTSEGPCGDVQGYDSPAAFEAACAALKGGEPDGKRH